MEAGKREGRGDRDMEKPAHDALTHPDSTHCDSTHSDLTHFNDEGRARMVDVSDKSETERVACAAGTVHLDEDTLRRIEEGRIGKGDVLAVAQVAGIMAAKRTSDLIPMCHPLMLTGGDIRFRVFRNGGRCGIDIACTVRCRECTGVEMEALTGVSVAALTIYDMCKAVQRDIHIGEIRLLSKSGGRSGDYRADGHPWTEEGTACPA